MDSALVETVGSSFRKSILTVLLAAIVPIFTGASYLTGLAFYRAYLHEFHIPASLVPISTAVHFVYAYRTISFLGWSAFNNHVVAFTIFGCIFLAVFQWIAMETLGGKMRRSRFLRYIRRRYLRGAVIRGLGRILLLPMAIAVAFSYISVFVMVLLIIPDALGGTAGKALAQEDLIAFRMGCINPKSSHFCNNIYEDKKLIFSGFIIGSSEKNLIVYDGENVVVTPRSNKTTVSAPLR